MIGCIPLIQGSHLNKGKLSMYRLPDGTQVNNKEIYSAAWQNKISKFCRLFDLQLVGYDPDYLLKNNEDRTLYLPVWFIDCVNKKLKRYSGYIIQR